MKNAPKVLVTGASGLLGRAILETLEDRFEVVGVARSQAPGVFQLCDITRSGEIERTVDAVKPDWVVHAAALVDVDLCEREPAEAFRVNALGSRNVAAAAQKVGAPVVYVSSDYVFDGRKGEPYVEEDKPNPINVYGRSKLSGEEMIWEISERCCVVRTCWLFGPARPTYADVALQAAMRGEPVKAVTDQVASPSYTPDVAAAIGRILESFPSERKIYHVANEGACSREEFVKLLLELRGLPAERLQAVGWKDLGRPARRPVFSALSSARFAADYGVAMRTWQDALENHLQIQKDPL